MPETHHCDLAIVGGGLAGGLIALAMAARRPDLSVRLIDSGEKLGGNHVWSFFDGDVAKDDRWLLTPLVCHAWPSYDVRFPAHSRTIAQPYYSIESERFDAVVRKALPASATAATPARCWWATPRCWRCRCARCKATSNGSPARQR